MSAFKRMEVQLEESEGEDPSWAAIPTLINDYSRRAHAYTGSYRLMEHVGRGRWMERDTGSFKDMQGLADKRNKEGYVTPLTPAEQSEVSRFSIMERARIVLQK